MQELLDTFKALSDETRLKILKILEAGELCVCDIVASMDMVQPKVSFHLNALKDAGLVKDRKNGKWSYYRLDDSDLFKRFLIFSVIERIHEQGMSEYKKRLEMSCNARAMKQASKCC